MKLINEIENILNKSSSLSDALKSNSKLITKTTSVKGTLTAHVPDQFKKEFEKVIKSDKVLNSTINNIDSTGKDILFNFDVK